MDSKNSRIDFERAICGFEKLNQTAITMRNKSHEKEEIPDSRGSIYRAIEEIDSKSLVVDQDDKRPTQWQLLNKILNNDGVEAEAQGRRGTRSKREFFGTLGRLSLFGPH